MNYYNENDPFAAAWLRELIKAGQITQGEVDERSIEDVVPTDLRGFTQCHFFAGIGGWSYALRLAGWPDDKPIWTGSCPCQPFSSAGKGAGIGDERHLWPSFYWLIQQCQPAIVFGEQTESKAGRQWLAGVRADLEAMGYQCGCADLCAASVSAPHRRQRLYWGAHTEGQRFDGKQDSPESTGRDGVENICSVSSGASDAADWRGKCRSSQRTERNVENRPWETYEWVETIDGRKFRNKPGLPLLAHGIQFRVGRLRGYGNAIVPQVAQEFVEAYIEAIK